MSNSISVLPLIVYWSKGEGHLVLPWLVAEIPLIMTCNTKSAIKVIRAIVLNPRNRTKLKEDRFALNLTPLSFELP